MFLLACSSWHFLCTCRRELWWCVSVLALRPDLRVPGCSETERADCVDDIEDVEKLADDKGCSSEYSDLASCVSDELECVDDRADADGCDAEAESLSECTNSPAGIGGDACQRAADRIVAKAEGCGIAVEDGGEEAECTDEAARLFPCYAACFEAAPCAALNGEDPDRHRGLRGLRRRLRVVGERRLSPWALVGFDDEIDTARAFVLDRRAFLNAITCSRQRKPLDVRGQRSLHWETRTAW